MKTWHLMMATLCLCFVGLAAWPAAAQGPQETEKDTEAEEEKEPDGQLVTLVKTVFKDIEKVFGDIEFNSADIDNIKKHQTSIWSLLEKDQMFTVLLNSSLHGAFQHVLKHEGYIAYCKEHDLDADRYARAAFRARTTLHKRYWSKPLKEMITKQREMIEGLRGFMGDEAYAQAIGEISAVEKDLDAADEWLKKNVPGPTEAENKLIDANLKELARAFDMEAEIEQDDDE